MVLPPKNGENGRSVLSILPILPDLADMRFNDYYRKYFEWQAINHPALGHDPATGDRIFQVIDIEESFGDFRTGAKEKSYLMRLLNYTYSISLEAHETHKILEGGFLVARYYSPRTDGADGYFQAMADAEKVMDEIIEKMIADSRNGHPLFYHQLNRNQDIMVQPIRYTGDVSYCGWRCIFAFRQFWRDCITSNEAPAWTDGGVTPYEF